MFIFWLFAALAMGAAENIKDSYNAKKFHDAGGLHAKYPHLFDERYK